MGHIISAARVHANPSKLRAIADWPTPRSITILRGFLGLTGFYRRFIHYYTSIATPLTDLLKQKYFHWLFASDTAFLELRATLLTLPILYLPDFS
ncbi:UNVERIFIED_CONTAM: putative mitochondrial protein [Sesamum latifolium]|uniref:Mitochondrial protein n=1 Tax=Sesamum latifolium TaxID=2727402 RepID=A0AAW2XCZ4_9LAMI